MLLKSLGEQRDSTPGRFVPSARSDPQRLVLWEFEARHGVCDQNSPAPSSHQRPQTKLLCQPSGLRILNLKELVQNEKQPSEMEVRGMAGMELSHPSGTREHQAPQNLCQGAQGLPEVPEPAPPSMSITNREMKHSQPQRSTTLGIPQSHTVTLLIRVSFLPSKEQGEEREATRRGMVVDGCLFNSGDSLFLAFFHTPFHYFREKPFCLD